MNNKKRSNNKQEKQNEEKILIDKDDKNEKKEEEIDKNLIKEINELNNLCQIKHQLDLSHIKINEKAVNKILKEKPFIVPVISRKPIKKSNENKKEEKKEKKEDEKDDNKKDDFNCCQYYMFPSGITKTSTKNLTTGEEKEEEVNYSCLDEKVYEKFKKNPTRELDILIGNTGMLFNTSPLMKSIVSKKISGFYLWDRLYIWKHYIKSLDDIEKISLIRHFLYRLKLFFQKCYTELINIDKIKNAFKILKKNTSGQYDEKEWNDFYISSKMLGYNPDGSVKEDNKKIDKANVCVLLEDKIKLNVQNELNGNGAGLIFVKELRNFSNMILYSKGVFEKVFEDCFDLLTSDFEDNYIKLHRILFKYFDNYILSTSFMAKMFYQLLLIYSTYKQDELVQFLHKLLVPKFNSFDELEKLENSISEKIGNDVQYDDEKKIEKFESIDDLVKFIETDEQKPKKKKKKKKNNNNYNSINDLQKINSTNTFEGEPDEDIYEGKEIPDNISVMSGVSEADSIVKAFKRDISSFNFSGEKLKANLSEEFIFNLE